MSKIMTDETKIAIFGSASGSSCIRYKVEDKFKKAIEQALEEYNNTEAWQARNCDGSADIVNTYEDAISKLGLDNEDDPCTNWEDLKEVIEQDGTCRDGTAFEVLLLLMIDPTSEAWSIALGGPELF